MKPMRFCHMFLVLLSIAFLSTACSSGKGESDNTPPSLSFTQPREAGQLADQSFSIEFTLSDPDSDARVSLYYNTIDSQDGWINIVTDLREDHTSHSWDTAALEEGEYYLFGVAEDDAQSVTVRAPGTVQVVHGSNVLPVLAFQNPDQAGEPADESYRIEFTATDPDSEATVSLFFNEEASGAGGTPIVAGLPEDATSYLWDTSYLPDGEYFVYGIIQDEVNTVRQYASGSVSIDHQQNLPPSITITEPNGVSDTANESFRIEIIASDPDSDATVSLYFDQDASGEDGTLIASDLPENTTSFDWDTSLVPEGGYYVYGIIQDEESTVTGYSAGQVLVRHDFNGCFPASTICSNDGFGFQACGVDPDDDQINSYGPRVPCEENVGCLDGVCQNQDCFVPEVMILLDRSSSMQGERFEWVHQGLSEALSRFEHFAYIGFRTFPIETCAAGETLTLALDNADEIEAAIVEPSVEASTPIVSALSDLPLHFGDANDGQVVVLITDGVETCTGPNEAILKASELFRSGVSVHTIAVTTQADVSFLNDLALNGGTGRSTLVQNQQEIFAALESIFFETHTCCDSLSITTQTLPPAQYGQTYQANIQTQGGYDQLTYSILSGDLPEGITLDPHSGLISGTPMEGGAFPFTLEVSDGCLRGIQQVQASYTLNVECDCDPVAITTSGLPAGEYGESYSEIIETQGGWGDIILALASGQLPQGISLNPANGVIAGTPQVEGDFTFEIRATDQCPCGTQSDTNGYLLAVGCHCPDLSISTSSLPDAEYAIPYSVQLQYNGGWGTVTWDLASGTLPDGITLNDSSGVLSGTTTELGSFPLTFRVTDQCDCPSGIRVATRAMTLVVNVDCPTLSLASTVVPAGVLGEPYQADLEHTGGYGNVTYQIVAGQLPSGLSLDPLSGVISGDPGQVGEFVVTAQVSDECPAGVQVSGQELTLEVCSSWQWAKDYVEDHRSRIASVRETTGGFIAAGNIGDYEAGSGNSQAWLFKLAPSGQILWQKTFGNSEFEQFHDMDVTPAGDILAAGRMPEFPEGTSRSAPVVKVDAQGDVIWQKVYNSVRDGDHSPESWNDEILDVHALPDGGALVAMDIYRTAYDAFVFRIDANGNVVWSTALAGSSHDTIYALRPTGDGGVIGAGRTFTDRDRSDIWVVKFDSLGQVTWQKTYGEDGVDDAAYDIVSTSDGGYLVTGRKYMGSNDYNMVLIKLDENGTIEWQKLIGTSGYDFGWALAVTSDFGLMVAGSVNSAMVLFRFENDGTFTWQKSYTGGYDNYGLSIQETADGGFISGVVINYPDFGDESAWILKTDAEGNVCGDCPASLGSDTSWVPVDTDLMIMQDATVPVDTDWWVRVDTLNLPIQTPDVTPVDWCTGN